MSHSPFCPASAVPTPALFIGHLPYDDRGAEDGGGDRTGSRTLDEGPAHRVAGRAGEIKTNLHVSSWVSSLFGERGEAMSE